MLSVCSEAQRLNMSDVSPRACVQCSGLSVAVCQRYVLPLTFCPRLQFSSTMSSPLPMPPIPPPFHPTRCMRSLSLDPPFGSRLTFHVFSMSGELRGLRRGSTGGGLHGGRRQRDDALDTTAVSDPSRCSFIGRRDPYNVAAWNQGSWSPLLAPRCSPWSSSGFRL